jgi:hypothetical protein
MGLEWQLCDLQSVTNENRVSIPRYVAERAKEVVPMQNSPGADPQLAGDIHSDLTYDLTSLADLRIVPFYSALAVIS